MHHRSKTAFRPIVESFEPRIVATGGVVSAAAHHGSHHPGHPHHHPTPHPPMPPVTPPPANTPPPPVAPVPAPNGTTNQAWVQLVNMTGKDLEYQIKLAPYAQGKFLTFDIAARGPNSVQYRMSSLLVNNQRVKADFAIQFGNGPITPLMTGISQRSAQGYYIFMDGNGQYYVSPFTRS